MFCRKISTRSCSIGLTDGWESLNSSVTLSTAASSNLLPFVCMSDMTALSPHMQHSRHTALQSSIAEWAEGFIGPVIRRVKADEAKEMRSRRAGRLLSSGLPTLDRQSWLTSGDGRARQAMSVCRQETQLYALFPRCSPLWQAALPLLSIVVDTPPMACHFGD